MRYFDSAPQPVHQCAKQKKNGVRRACEYTNGPVAADPKRRRRNRAVAEGQWEETEKEEERGREGRTEKREEKEGEEADEQGKLRLAC